MARKKAPKVEQVHWTDDAEPDMREIYDTCMAEVYDIMMDAYDKVGVKVKEMLEDYYPEHDDPDWDTSDDEYDLD